MQVRGYPIQGELTYPLNSVIETEEFERMLDWYALLAQG